MSYSVEQRAISHRDWSRKKAPISRVGSYDFNGTVDRATMKMHMAAANRTVSSTNRVLTLWPLSSSAIDKNECFAVREREVLWSMRAGKGMGRTTDGRMKALSSLNYFRLVLEDWQIDQLKEVLNEALNKSVDENEAMRILKAVVGDKRMDDEDARTIKEVHLNKIDEHLRHYVLGNIQYAGVVITGEEPGSKQSLQGIAVTVGGLNTLANNGDKTLCPGMKLCMTVPRCVPDSTQWPAPCDHIGLPHGKVTPILRQAEPEDLTQVILGGTNHIHRRVARMMSGCCGYGGSDMESEDKMWPCKASKDVYFAFKEPGPQKMNTSETLTSANEILTSQFEVMRRINDAVVLTMKEAECKMDVSSSNNVRFEKLIDYDPAAMEDASGLVFGTRLDEMAKPDIGGITQTWRLVLIAYGNIRDVVIANANANNTDLTKTFGRQFFNFKDSAPVTSAALGYKGLFKDGIRDVFTDVYKNRVPECLKSKENLAENEKDPDAKHYAAMITDIMANVAHKLRNKVLKLIDESNNILSEACSVKYHSMQAVSNGNAAFALGYEGHAEVAKLNDGLDLDEFMQPNIVVMDEQDKLPWHVQSITDIVVNGRKSGVKHATSTIIFRKHFDAPMRCDDGGNEHIELSDNELPFVGAWIALSTLGAVPDDAATPYRSNFAPDRFLVHQDTTNKINYYYLTWSGFVHLVCHNVLGQEPNGKLILEMQRAELVQSPHYVFKKPMDPTLAAKGKRKFGAPGLGSYLHAILQPDKKKETQYQDYLRKHSPIASLVNSVIRATVEAVTQHQLSTDKKTVGMALSSAGRGEAVDVVLTGAV